MIREKKSWLTGILVFALLCTLLLVVPQEHAMAASKKVPAFDKTKQIVFVGDEDSYVDSIKFVNVSLNFQIRRCLSMPVCIMLIRELTADH